MALWTDLVEPANLTGYVRASMADYEQRKGTLASFLPNRTVPDIVARFVAGQNGLQPAAEYRSYDAETPIGAGPQGRRVTIDLPALGKKVRVSELDQLRMRNAPEEQQLTSIENTAASVGRSVSDRIEYARGQVLATGKATINENQFVAEADFDRDPSMTKTASTLWSDDGARLLDDIEAWMTSYADLNGDVPGTMAVSRRILSTMARSSEFRSLAKNSTDVSVVSQAFINDTLAAYGLPSVVVYDRKVKTAAGIVPVLPANKVLFLPSPVDVNDAEGTDLGATTWGVTLEADEPDYDIAEQDRPGVVVGTYKDDDPLGVWVKAAAIGLPTLANPNLSMVATVIA